MNDFDLDSFGQLGAGMLGAYLILKLVLSYVDKWRNGNGRK